MKITLSKEWCEQAAALEAGQCVTAGAPSGLGASKERPHEACCAVSTGSFPVWSVGLFALADTWDERARKAEANAALPELQGRKIATIYRDAAIHWRFVANELRAEIVAASVRQPEENI